MIDQIFNDARTEQRPNFQLTVVISSGEIDKFECLADKGILTSGPSQVLKQVKFTYSPLLRMFEKQTKRIESQREKQIIAIEKHGNNLLKTMHLIIRGDFDTSDCEKDI